MSKGEEGGFGGCDGGNVGISVGIEARGGVEIEEDVDLPDQPYGGSVTQE